MYEFSHIHVIRVLILSLNNIKVRLVNYFTIDQRKWGIKSQETMPYIFLTVQVDNAWENSTFFLLFIQS